MGTCFSSTTTTTTATGASIVEHPTAKVIAIDGALTEYLIPLKASQVLGLGDPSGYFLCNSDSLYYHDHIPALGPNEPVQLGQLYFILPVTKLGFPLSGPDMAELAVKASSALAAAAKSRRSPAGVMARVMPLAELDDNTDWNKIFNEVSVSGHSGFWATTHQKKKKKSGKSDSLRAKSVKLSTIEENDE